MKRNIISNGELTSHISHFADAQPYRFVSRKISACENVIPGWQCHDGVIKILTQAFWQSASNYRRIKPPKGVSSAVEFYTLCHPSALTQSVQLATENVGVHFLMMFNPWGTSSSVCGGVSVSLTATDGRVYQQDFPSGSCGGEPAEWVWQSAVFQIEPGDYYVTLKNILPSELENPGSVLITDIRMYMLER
jgi:hypothetical protein